MRIINQCDKFIVMIICSNAVIVSSRLIWFRSNVDSRGHTSARFVGGLGGVRPPPSGDSHPQVFIDSHWFSHNSQKCIAATPSGFTTNRVLGKTLILLDIH